MKFGNDLSVTVENAGDNQGMEVGINNGSVIMQYGLGYSDIKALCLDIICNELAKYHAEALIEAQKRNDQLFEQFIEKLQENNMTDTQALAEFRNPSMQLDYLEAQKAYMKSGTPELLELLSNILVNRISEQSRTLLQISLGEAIQVVPKLVQSQMATLALVFIVKHTRRTTVNNHEAFATFLKDTIIPIFRSGVSQKNSEFQHLCFTGCTQQTDFGNRLIENLKLTYSSLFMEGFNGEDIPQDEDGNYLANLYPELFMLAINSEWKIQIAANNMPDLLDKIKQLSMPEEHKEMFIQMFKDNLLSDDEAQKQIEDQIPEMAEVFQYWDSSEIMRCFLSSVGIVIGAEYSHQITGRNYDLSIWI